MTDIANNNNKPTLASSTLSPYSDSCASSVTSMLGMGREDEDVDAEVGTVGGGEPESWWKWR